MTVRLFDTETTGTDHTKDQIIEAAWIDLLETPAKFRATDPQHLPFRWSRYKPSVPISLGAQAVHHIVCADLVNEPESSTFKFPAGTSYLVGHNIDFDWRMAGEPDVPRIDTLPMCRFLFLDKDSHTLSAMLYMIGRRYGKEGWARDLLKGAHAALDDVRNNALVLRYILMVAEDEGHDVSTWQAVYEFSELSRIPSVISFGKHKGSKISELPADYVRWYRRQPETDPYLLEAFKRAGF